MQASLPGVKGRELFGVAAIEAGAFRGKEEVIIDHVPLPDPDVGALLGHQQPLLALAQGAADGLGSDPGTDGIVHQVQCRQAGAALGIERHLLIVQQLLGQLALRDVLHSAIELDDIAVPVPQGGPTGGDPDGVPLLVDDAGIAFIGLPVVQAALDGLG